MFVAKCRSLCRRASRDLRAYLIFFIITVFGYAILYTKDCNFSNISNSSLNDISHFNEENMDKFNSDPSVFQSPHKNSDLPSLIESKAKNMVFPKTGTLQESLTHTFSQSLGTKITVSATPTRVKSPVRPTDPFELIDSMDTGEIQEIPLSEFKHKAILDVINLPEFQKVLHLQQKFRPKDLKIEAPKYFHEQNITLLDIRYANPKVFYDKNQRRKVNIQLLAAWAEFCEMNGFISWLAHGTLLGWFWGQSIFPWDHDLDFQMTLSGMMKLWKFNHTMHRNRYLIDVNPNSIYRLEEKENVIDARLIDTKNGMYIDITALADNDDNGFVWCKSPHRYMHEYISPLHATKFENVTVWRPNKTVFALLDEYLWKSMEDREVEIKGKWYIFNETLQRFVENPSKKIISTTTVD